MHSIWAAHPRTHLSTEYPPRMPIGPILGPKFLGAGVLTRVKAYGEEGRISQKLRENCKNRHFKGRKTLRNGSHFGRAFWSKTSLELQEGPISQTLLENCKISHF